MPLTILEQNEDVVELINEPPKWVIKNGLAVLFFLICFMIILTNFISYKETIDIETKISIDPIYYFKGVYNSSGKPSKILRNGSKVNVGDTIFVTKDSLKRSSIIKTTISGNIYLYPSISSSSNVLLILPTIIPAKIYTYLTFNERFNIKKGMSVILPVIVSNQQKTIEGKIDTVSEIPFENKYIAEIKLYKTLNSKDLYILSQSKIMGKVITRNRSLFSRIFNI